MSIFSLFHSRVSNGNFPSQIRSFDVLYYICLNQIPSIQILRKVVRMNIRREKSLKEDREKYGVLALSARIS